MKARHSRGLFRAQMTLMHFVLGSHPLRPPSFVEKSAVPGPCPDPCPKCATQHDLKALK